MLVITIKTGLTRSVSGSVPGVPRCPRPPTVRLPPANANPPQQAVEDSAPAQDRIRYLSTLSFPPRWELRRDLAQRYAGMGVLGSAAEEFVELEMWVEAVECYRQMQQVPKKNEVKVLLCPCFS